MHECNLSDEICEFISYEDFCKLVSEPGFTEDEFTGVDFKVTSLEFEF